MPRLAGQHAAYLAGQIKIFQQTEPHPRGDLTQQVAHAMTDEDAESVAHYLASLGAKK